MCRSKENGGRRCQSTAHVTALNTVNRRIQRNRKKVETVTEDNLENIKSKISNDLSLRETIKENNTDARKNVEKDGTTGVEESHKKRSQEYNEEEQKIRSQYPLAPLPASKKRVKIFRSGIPEAPAERGVEKQAYLDGDEHKPEGRVGRTEGVFASPTLHGAARWVKGNNSVGMKDVDVREITVDPDEVYVYSIDEWERTSRSSLESNSEAQKAAYKKFWDSGITLREWYDRGVHDGDQWELILSQDNMKSVKPTPPSQVVKEVRDDYFSREVLDILKPLKSRRRRTSGF